MNNKHTLICFVSYTNPSAPEASYTSDFGTFNGRQTNVAPTCYAIERLKNKKGSSGTPAAASPVLDRILAIKTDGDGGSNFDGYEKEVIAYCNNPENMITPPEIVPITVEDSSTQAEILNKVIDKLQEDEPTSVIIETTGGFRSAITALTLLSRFLYVKGIKVEFSTYANNSTKNVGVTQDYQMYGLLEATSAFVDTGNERELNAIRNQLGITEAGYLFKAIRQFRSSILTCNIRTLEDNITVLRNAFENMKADTALVTTANGVVFKHILLETIENKMSFIKADHPLVEVAQWCVDNWHLQQAVTILREKLLKDKLYFPYRMNVKSDKFDFHVIRHLRNSINHAEGKAVEDKYEAIPASMRKEVIDKVDKLLNDPNEGNNSNLNNIKGVVNSALSRIRKRI